MVKTTKNDVNACEDFFEIVISGFITASALATFELKSMHDTPSNVVVPRAEDVWAQPESERRDCLNKLCRRVCDKFVNFSYNNVNRESNEDGVYDY